MRMTMEYDEYEPEPTLKERAIMMARRAIPYAVGILVLCVLMWIVCSIAARIEDRGASSQWGCVIESARRNLKNSREGQ